MVAHRVGTCFAAADFLLAFLFLIFCCFFDGWLLSRAGQKKEMEKPPRELLAVHWARSPICQFNSHQKIFGYMVLNVAVAMVCTPPKLLIPHQETHSQHSRQVSLQRLHFEQSRYNRQSSSHTTVEPSQGCLLPLFCPKEWAYCIARKIWQFGGPPCNHQIEICQYFILAYIYMVIPYQTAKFKSTNIITIVMWDPTVKFNSRQYYCNSDVGPNRQI